MTRWTGPTSAPPPPPDDETTSLLIDAYIDGEMPDRQRAEFEASLRADEALAREVALQRKAESSLRRQFQPPPAPAVPRAPVGAGMAIGPPPRRRLFLPLAAAAMVVLAVAVYFVYFRGVSVGPVYHRVVDAGFVPQWVCESDEQFAQYTQQQFGAAWRFEKDPSITLVGWRYSEDVLSPDESVLLATRNGTKIVVVADEASHDRRLRGSDGLRVFRREVEGLVLYEISPLEEPVVIGRIRLDEPGTK